MENQKFEIATAQSGVEWIGRKVTGAHNGTIDFKSGTLYLAAGQLVGGEFTVVRLHKNSSRIWEIH